MSVRKILFANSWLLAIAIPAALILYLALSTGPLPDNDYWGIIKPLLTSEWFSSSQLHWLNRSNEHLVIVPKLLYALNIQITDGSNTGLAIIAWSAALLCAIALATLVLPASIRTDADARFLFTLVLAIFVFTPRASHNWIMGMSGVAWITANLFAVLAIAGFYRLALTQRYLWLVFSLAAGFFGMLTYSTVLALWPALIFGAWYLGLPKRVVIVYLLCCAAIYALYIAGYQQPHGHPEIALSLSTLAEYVLKYIGGTFTLDPESAHLMGAIGVAAATVLFCVLLFKRRDDALRTSTTPWLLIQIYVVGTALMAALSRSGFSIDQALSSRYASLPALFWASLFITALLTIYILKPLYWKRLSGALITVIAVSAAFMYQTSLPHINKLLQREQDKRLAAVSLVTGIYDMKLLLRTASPAISELLTNLDSLQSTGHIPFTKSFEACSPIGKKITGQTKENGNPTVVVRGFFDGLTPVDQNGFKVVGWAYSDTSPLACIVITNQEMVVRGSALPGFPRPDVAKVLGIDEQNTGWAGYVRLTKRDESLRAWARFSQEQSWHPLQNSHHPLNLEPAVDRCLHGCRYK